ncbi:MAG TPA: FkbM family methyltransferase [Vicinamibacterales bacterium]|nr:FkbM family methyltransferase [Vicinamibacterales bacterium]
MTPAVSTPWWISLSSTAIRTLPFGRYQVANAIARVARRPFVARMPLDLGGASFICDLQDTISREVCLTGRYEPQETQLALHLLQPGMTVVDVGANWGYFTLACAHVVGAAGRVLALEPHPRLMAMLSENVRVNGLSQVEPLMMAAGAGAGRRGFIAFDERGGNWGLTRTAQPAEAADFDSEITTIDALIDERRWPHVDLLKMDIEGAEAEALTGMAGGFARRRYRFVLLECHPAQITAAGATMEECLAIFDRAGYRAWHIDHSAAMHRRAAAGAVSLEELLAPVDWRALRADPWPHLLFAAPDEGPPA